MRSRKSSLPRANRARKTRVDSATKSNVGGRRRKSIGRSYISKPSTTESAGPLKTGSNSFPIVGVGASAGGLEAFTALLAALPVDTGMAFVLVQHLDPRHESKLSMLLSRGTKMPVVEISDGTPAQPDCVYVIPPNTDLTVVKGVLRLTPRLEETRHHLAVDYFLRSLAKDKKSKAIGVVLSGTGSDGAQGLKAVKAEGGVTFAQDQASAKYDGMPRSAVAAGAVDYVLPPAKIAKELARIGRHPYVTRFGATPPEDLSPATDDAFTKTLLLLRSATGVDFSAYKPATIRRRIARRLALHQLDTLELYVKHLRDNPVEVKALFQDILISVTEFFRDPKTVEALEVKVFPSLIKNRSLEVPIRIWVPGCSTGEEPYSLVISLWTFLGNIEGPPIQVFATDINEAALEKARTGKYAESIASQMSPEYLRRFFTMWEGGYQIKKAVRELVVFSRHNLAHDPPFSRMDLISCRNVLIYLGAALQKRVLPMFHYALKPTGFLILGSSETIGIFPDLFALVGSKQKIYSRKSTPSRLDLVVAANQPPEGVDNGNTRSATIQGEFQMQHEVDRILLSRYAPAGVVIDDRLDILEVRGHTGLFLEPAPGRVSFNLPKMAREGLALELRAAIQQARNKEVPVRKEGLKVRSEDRIRDVNLEVIPIEGAAERSFLILFEDVTQPAALPAKQMAASGEKHPAQKQSARDKMIERLQRELTSARQDLQSVIEEMESANEDLRSANEETLSSNEELQSTNEELETAKEELQATNEELTTVNEELQNRNVELSRANSDLVNLLLCINMPIVLLGNDLRIRRFTPLAEEVLNLIATDVGRPIKDLKPNIRVPDLEELFLKAIDTVSVTEREVQDAAGRWYSMQIRPYKTAENRIDGAVMVLVDIDSLRRAQDLTAILETVRQPLLVLDADLRVKNANRSFYEVFRVRREETENKLIYELGNGQWEIPELRSLLELILPKHSQFDDFEVEHQFPRIGRRKVLLHARQVVSEDNRPKTILLAIEDITEHGREHRVGPPKDEI